jgi:WD40 repeat protein
MSPRGSWRAKSKENYFVAESKQGSQGSVFISYSRKDKPFVQKLNDALDNSGVHAWVDWEGIELASDWMQRITTAIQGSDAFLFVISPDSLKSKVCADELELGIKLNKKLIPILYREPSKDQTMHQKLSATNWVYMRKDDNFEETLPKLIESIQTDLEWVGKHTQLLNQAVEWESKNRNNSFLLQGTVLEDAEKWMADASGKENRNILPLQAEFIQSSRKGAEKRQRMLLAGVSLALVVSIVLSIVAIFARNAAEDARVQAVAAQAAAETAQAEAEVAREEANANALEAEQNRQEAVKSQKEAEDSARLALAASSAAEAQNLQTAAGKLNTSALLAMESYNINATDDSESLIRTNASLMAIPVKLLKQDGAIWNIEWSPDYAYFVTGNNQDSAIENASAEACVYQASDGSEVFCVEHESDINDAIFSKDGKQLITASADKTVKFWDATNGSLVNELTFGGAVLDIDATDSIIAIGREDNFLTLYYPDIEGVKAIDKEQAEGVRTVKFSPNGDNLAFGLQNGQLRFWQRRSDGYYNGPIHEKSSYVVLAWSPDSNWVVSGGGDSLAKLTKRDGTFKYDISHEDWVEGVAWGEDASWFVTVSDDNKVRVVNADEQSEWFRMSHTNFAQKVIVSQDGEWIASTGYDRVVRIWDSISGIEVLQIPLSANGSAIAFNQDGTRLISADEDGNIGIWDISKLKARIGYIVFKEFVREARFTPAGDSLIVNSDDFNVWKLPTDQITAFPDGTQGEILLTTQSLTYETAVSPDSQWVAVVELDTEDTQKNRGTLISIDGKIVTPLIHGGEVTDVDFTPDSKSVATSGADGKVVFWDVQTGEKQFELDNLDAIASISISPSGTLVAVGLFDKVRVWDYSTKTLTEGNIDQPGEIASVVFSHDGNMLATGSADGTVMLWKKDGNTFTQVGETIHINGSRRMMLEFSPDNKWLAGGSFGFAYLWDTATAQEFARIPHGSNPVTSVSFTNDGKQLLTASRKIVRVWDISAIPVVFDENLLEFACSHLTTNLDQDEWNTYFGQMEYRTTCPGLPVKE